MEIVHRKELRADPESRERLTELYKERFMNPYLSAARGLVDEIIEPADTRKRIAGALEALSQKDRKVYRKRHGNIPL